MKSTAIALGALLLLASVNATILFQPKQHLFPSRRDAFDDGCARPQYPLSLPSSSHDIIHILAAGYTHQISRARAALLGDTEIRVRPGLDRLQAGLLLRS